MPAVARGDADVEGSPVDTSEEECQVVECVISATNADYSEEKEEDNIAIIHIDGLERL